MHQQPRRALVVLAALVILASSACSRSGASIAQPGNATAPPDSGTPPSDGGTASAVAVSPTTASLPAATSLGFTATVGGAAAPVTWSVAEGDAGGTVTPAGVYTAPQSAGTYHVVARSASDAAQSASATVTVTPPPGPQFYVATNGNDANPGTEAQPWRTIQKAMSAATPGSTVNIRAGTYPERLTVNVSGTAGNFVTFQPYGFTGAPGCGGHTGVPCGGEAVVLDYSSLGTVSDGVPYLKMSGQSYVRIQGLTFQNLSWIGGMQRGIWFTGGSHDVEFKFNRIANVHTTAPLDRQNALLHFWIDSGSHDVSVYGNEIGPIDTSDGEVLTPVNCDRVTIERNWIHDTDQIAINVGQGATNTAVRGNYLEYCSMARDGSARYGIFAGTIYNNGAAFTTIEDNVVTRSGLAIEVSAEPSYPVSHDIVIRNNVVANSSSCIMLGNWYSTDTSRITGVQVTNNTLYGCQTGLEMQPFSNVQYEDNIVASCQTAIVNPAGMSPAMDYNLYSGGGSGPDAHKVTADPKFVNATAGDFRLAPGSPAIDAGNPAFTTADVGATDVAGAARIVGGRVDIGANEAQ